MWELISRSTGTWKLWESQEEAVPAGRKVESKLSAQVSLAKINYLRGSQPSLTSLFHRPCPQTGPWRGLQRKPRPLGAKVPPRTCGPAPSPSSGTFSRVPSKARLFWPQRPLPP